MGRSLTMVTECHSLPSNRFFSNSSNSKIATINSSKFARNTIKPVAVYARRRKSSSYSRKTLSSSWTVPGISPITSPATSFPSLDELDTTNMMLQQRIVFLGSQIDELTADFIISQLLFLDAEDPTKDIKLFINCSGGSSTSAMGIYDVMKLCKADVSTICMGLAASVGAFLLAAGTKGKRHCMPNSRIMIHQLSGVVGGRVSDMAIRAREISYQRIKLMKIMSKITGKSVEQVESDTYHDKFLNPWEAKEYGLIDEVIDDGKEGLVAPVFEALPPPKPGFLGLWVAEVNHDDLPSESKLVEILES